MPGAGRPRVVIIGGGFAGLTCARGLKRAPVSLLLIDRRNHHLFQPLLYQVATASLSPADIAAPIRHLLSRQRNAEVLLAEASRVDTERRFVVAANGDELRYDWLVVATGATHSYFGHPEWARFAPGLKDIPDALTIRERFLLAFERAERETDPHARRAALTFIVVGGGPTGVELAGAMAEIARKAIPRDFRSIDTTTARVILIQAGDRVLETYDPDLSRRAKDDLERLGVDVWLNTRVTSVDERGVEIGEERIAARNVVWAAGVEASALGASLGAETDSRGRVKVSPDLTIPGHPEVFVLGDLAAVESDGKEVPGVAPAAMQMGEYAARVIRSESQSGPNPASRKPFRYRDKGSLATIGRARAVVETRRMKLAGLPAWVIWLTVHLFFLIGFRNRLLVLIQWAWAYFTFERGARLITGTAEERLGPIEEAVSERPASTPAGARRTGG